MAKKKKTRSKLLRNGLIGFLIGFIWTIVMDYSLVVEEGFVANLPYMLFYGLLIGSVVFFITYTIEKSEKYGKFPIKGWRWIFYIIGWMTGILNLLFWGIMALAQKKEEKGFFNPNFHKRVVIWGIFMSVFLAIVFVIAFML